ncbi:MAG: toll/interleukin-1 receptor domain-containing protein [Candidatus Binatia bacterium]
MGSVFISYRREDSEGQARALFQDLVARLGRDSVFMDVDSIGLGRDFRAVLQERLATCDVMLALIGRDWVDGKDKSGRRRLDIPGDFVRMEISAALKRNIPVTPLLIHGAQMPTAEQLPEGLSDLAYRNGFELSHNRWESDVQELVKRLGLVTRNDTPPGAKTGAAAPTRQAAKKPWFAIAGASVIAVAVGGFLYYQKTPRETLKTEKADPSAGANTAANKPIADAESANPLVAAGKGKLLGDAPKAGGSSLSMAKNLLDASLTEKKNASSGVSDKRGGQEKTHTLNSSDFQLKISTEGSYISSPFRVDNLDLSRDFLIDFQIKSTRNGGSTRYGIAWNYRPEDFLLFTLHSTNRGYYSIGPGRSRTYAPFSRLSEGFTSINGENNFDTLQMRMNGSALVFAINGNEVWRTTSYKVNSNQFAFWVADYSEALIKSYTVHQ